MLSILALIALTLGYRVFLIAGKEQNGARILGQIIGIGVMVVSLFFFVMGFCPKYGKYGSCAYKAGGSQAVCPYGLKGPK